MVKTTVSGPTMSGNNPPKRSRRSVLRALGATTVAAGTTTVGVSAPNLVRAKTSETLKLGWTAWDDAEAMSKMAAIVVQNYLETRVDLTLADIERQYEAVAAGDLDAMMMAWLPETHRPYIERYGDDLVDLGAMYGGCRLGLVVPAGLDDIRSIDDLARNPDAVGGQILGIEESSGIHRMTERAMAGYGLGGLELASSSDPVMSAEIDRKMSAGEPFVSQLWTPHWLFARHELRFLEDPRGIFGGAESVHIMSNRRIAERHGDGIRAFLERYEMSLERVQGLVATAREHGSVLGSDYRAAVVSFLQSPAGRNGLRYWLTGEGRPI